MGCHSGTLMSRDAGNPEPYESLDACRDAVAQAERDWARMGYYVWFATATGPNGEKETLHPGVPYY